MLVLNLTQTAVFLDDINFYVPFNKTKTPALIPPELAAKSSTLARALSIPWLIDVTNGVPAKLPEPKFDTQTVSIPEDATDGPTAIEAFKETGAMSVAWTGYASDMGGYANLNRKFMFGLSDAGVRLKHVLFPSPNDIGRADAERLLRLQQIKLPRESPAVYSMPAPICRDKRHKIFLTMMETNRLHEDYVERCNAADEIVVPSRWCKKVFEESGVTRPISVVPLGVDLRAYRPDVAPLAFAGSSDFVFLSVFQWSLRKGYDVLLKAYFREFTSDDPVTLAIASRFMGMTDEGKKSVIKREIARIAAEAGNPRRPRIAFFGDVLPDETMPALYSAADCFVLVSRGEGFGLPLIEAGACGVPVISSRYSGQTDFLDDDNSYLVDVDRFVPPDPSLEAASRFFQGIEFPEMGDLAVEQTQTLMRRVLENRAEAENKARKLSLDIEQKYGWPCCIGQMHKKLNDTFRLLSGR